MNRLEKVQGSNKEKSSRAMVKLVVKVVFHVIAKG
jgi:hypothetical protein